jgi:xanthine/CO dehydrogenase XdhC/CoxF family maturation factor
MAGVAAAFDDAGRPGVKTAPATVVPVKDLPFWSSGARMLLTGEGQLTGAIGGGCLNGDASGMAGMVITASALAGYLRYDRQR